jgi:hypothetical protein
MQKLIVNLIFFFFKIRKVFSSFFQKKFMKAVMIVIPIIIAVIAITVATMIKKNTTAKRNSKRY